MIIEVEVFTVMRRSHHKVDAQGIPIPLNAGMLSL